MFSSGLVHALLGGGLPAPLGGGRGYLAPAHALQKLELVAGIDENGAGGLAAADAQDKLAHGLEPAHQGGVVAVAAYDAEAVNKLVFIGDLQGVDNQLDVRVVFLGNAVAQGGHHRKGVAQKDLLQVAEAVGVAINLAQQNIPADLHLFQDAVQGGHLGATVFQIHKNGKLGRAGCTQWKNLFSNNIKTVENLRH